VAKQPVRLANSLLPTSALRPQVQIGLGALTVANRELIALARRPEIRDSLDLDQAMEPTHAEENRWDYLMATTQQRIIGFEPHPARDDEVGVVIAKKQEAQTYLSQHLAGNAAVSAWYWVSSGTVGFSRMERATRRLAQKGIKFAGRMLRSFD
jgi:hypothetical protein